MKIELDLPMNWQTPDWHPDWGDPAIELAHLREFSLQLLKAHPGVRVSLDVFEPGYMLVEVRWNNVLIGVVYSNEDFEHPGRRLLAMFLYPDSPHGKEIYAESVDAGVRTFVECIEKPDEKP